MGIFGLSFISVVPSLLLFFHLRAIMDPFRKMKKDKEKGKEEKEKMKTSGTLTDRKAEKKEKGKRTMLGHCVSQSRGDGPISPTRDVALQ